MSEPPGEARALAHLAAILDCMPDAALAADEGGRIVAANELLIELSGYDRAELLGCELERLVPGDLRGRHREHRERFSAAPCRRAMGAGFRPTLQRHDGSLRPVEISLSPFSHDGMALVVAGIRDISERHTAQEALASSERRFRALLHRNPAGIFRSTAEGRLLECNDAFARMFGYGSAEEIRDRPVHELYFDARDRDQFVAELRRSGSLDHYAERLRRRDGAEFWALTAATLLEEPELGTVIQGALVDVTGLRAAESAVRASEQRYRELFHHNAAGVFRAAIDGRLIECNDAFARIFGWASGAELAGRSWIDLCLDPEEPARLLVQLRGAGSLRNVELRGRRRDGSEVRTLAAANLTRDGAVRIVEGTILDVTEQRRAEAAVARAEAQFRSLFEAMGAVIWRADARSFRFTEVSPRGEALLGYPITRWLEDDDFWRERVHPEDREAAVAHCARETEALRDHTLEYRMLRADGGVVWVLDVAHVVAEAGRPVALVGVFVDLTERKALEEQLRQAQKMEAVGRLASGIAHDFNNLMGVVLGYSELLLESNRDGSDRDRLEEIRQASERATGLTRQLLAYSRRQVLQVRTVELNRLVAGYESMLQRVLGEDVRLETAYDPGLWSVAADPGQLEQVLLNLAVNSRDAMPAGGVLRIETANVELDGAFVGRNAGSRPGRYACLRVTDNGVGMDAETLAHVFEPFFTTKEPGRGTGLGLATVYGIVKQSNGYITVESRPGQGTVVAIYLPRTLDPSGVVATGAATAPARSGGAETILLVEDARPLRRLVHEILVRAGYRVLEAASPGAALTLASEFDGRIDLVLTDVVMPEMRGHDLAGVLRASRPELRVVYMSGFSEEVVGAAARGRLHFLQKPFTADLLLRTLREALVAPG